MSELDNSRGMTVTTLLNRSVQCLIEDLPQHEHELHLLPANLKDKLLSLMSSRGLFTDDYTDLLVHSKVKSLDLSDCDITDRALESVAHRCQVLQKIKLNSVRERRPAITTAGVTLLGQNCRHLQIVSILRCPLLTDPAVESLARGCLRLSQLSLNGCSQLSDASLRALAEHSRFLQNLNIGKTNITDNGICSLASDVGAKCLRELHISGCRAITDESIEAILAFCPNLTYFLFYGCPRLTDAARHMLQSSEQQAQLKHVAWTIY